MIHVFRSVYEGRTLQAFMALVNALRGTGVAKSSAQFEDDRDEAFRLTCGAIGCNKATLQALARNPESRRLADLELAADKFGLRPFYVPTSTAGTWDTVLAPDLGAALSIGSVEDVLHPALYPLGEMHRVYVFRGECLRVKSADALGFNGYASVLAPTEAEAKTLAFRRLGMFTPIDESQTVSLVEKRVFS